jgi:hypothetical protein
MGFCSGAEQVTLERADRPVAGADLADDAGHAGSQLLDETRRQRVDIVDGG